MDDFPSPDDPRWADWLSAPELAYCAGLQRSGEHLVARLLAKRAVFRTLGWPESGPGLPAAQPPAGLPSTKPPDDGAGPPGGTGPSGSGPSGEEPGWPAGALGLPGGALGLLVGSPSWPDPVPWQDVEIRREPSGRPRVALTGRLAEWARRRGLPVPQVSLTHAAGYAAALAWLPGGVPFAGVLPPDDSP